MFARTFFPLSLTTNPILPILFHQLRNITKNSLHPLSIFRSKRESERSYRNEEENIIPIYIHVSPPLFEYIGFEFWVWVNSMKTRPNRGTVCKLPIASFPQVFRAPVSDKYSTKDTFPLLLPPSSVSMRAVDYDRDISRVYRSSRFRKRLNTNRARPASLESNYLEILSPSTRYACTFAIINDPDPARSLTALVDRRGGGGGGGEARRRAAFKSSSLYRFYRNRIASRARFQLSASKT